MSTSEISSRSLEHSPSLERRQELLNDVAAIGSARSDDTQTASIIAIAVKAHEKMLMDPFSYALHHLVKQKNHKVVVICCMSRVRTELGVDLLVDETFRGISKKKLEGAVISQRNNMNHFLRAIRERLDEKGVQLEIQIYIGHKSDDILVKAAKVLKPQWVVLDISFAGHQNKIQAAVNCDLVLMKKKKDSGPLVLQLTSGKKELGPVDHIHDQVSEEVVNPILGNSSPSMRIPPSISTDRTSRQNGASPTISTEAPLTSHDTGETATSSTDTENGYPAPPELSPAQVATPPIQTPLHTDRPTESGRPVPSVLSWVATQSRQALRRSPALSSTQVATKSLPASIHLPDPVPFPVLPTMATPPKPPSSTSRSKTATPTSSTSRTTNARENPGISRPLSEPIPFEISLAMAINASLQTNRPNSTSQSKPAGTPTSSSSRTWTREANPSISRPLCETIPYETAAAMAINASLLPNPPNSTSQSKPGTPTSSSSRTWTREANPSISRPLPRPLCEPIPYETALAMAINASLLPNPPNSTRQSKPSTPTSLSSRTRTREANLRISSPLCEPIPYETALAMAMTASLISAKEEGVPVSPSAQQSSSSWDDGESNMRLYNGLVPKDAIPHIPLNASILSDSEEDAPSIPLIRRGCSSHVAGSEDGAPLFSFPLPENVSSCDGGQGHRGPADRNNTHTDEFRGWREEEQSSNSNWGPGSMQFARVRSSKLGLSIADVPSTSEFSESGIPKPTPSPTSVFAFSSHQSFTQVDSSLTRLSPSAPPLPFDGPVRYPSVDTSPIHYPAVGSGESPPATKKANARSDGECVVCWDSPADAVCIPCGHIAGCMNCLTEIKSIKCRCPVCRETIQQVVKIYVV